MTNKKITIAIDGFSSCGKSTLAKELANELNYIFIDSGAMYRGVTLFALRNNLISNTDVDREGIIDKLADVNLEFKANKNDAPSLLLNGENVADEIRTPIVSSFVSKIAEIKEVRTKLVGEQQKMGNKGGIIMDGRDIGTVVFPSADLKLFITADVDIRTERRFKELIARGFETTRDAVRENLIKRDHIDSNREESPLTKAETAIEIDNTQLSREEQMQKALDLVEEIIIQQRKIFMI